MIDGTLGYRGGKVMGSGPENTDSCMVDAFVICCANWIQC